MLFGRSSWYQSYLTAKMKQYNFSLAFYAKHNKVSIDTNRILLASTSKEDQLQIQIKK